MSAIDLAIILQKRHKMQPKPKTFAIAIIFSLFFAPSCSFFRGLYSYPHSCSYYQTPCILSATTPTPTAFVDVTDAPIHFNDNLFREYVREGIQKLLDGDVIGSVTAWDNAARCNSSQPLQQRGIVLYCVGRFDCAEQQLKEDIRKFEIMKVSKASELRIWRSAALNKLGRFEEAKKVLDVNNLAGISVASQSKFVNATLSFFYGETPVEDMISITGNPAEKDLSGNYFYGNFFLGLYFDSIGESSLAEAFLAIPNESTRYSKKDMWYHIPRLLVTNRKEVVINDKQ